MNRVICKLPNAGLGNQLFPLMKSLVFAEINHLPVTVTNYLQFRIGPYLRREKNKRKYAGTFVFQKGLLNAAGNWFTSRISKINNQTLKEVKVEIIRKPLNDTVYLFCEVPHWQDYFVDLREYRDTVINLFYKNLAANILEDVNSKTRPSIGVHIRMGDYRKLLPDEDFSKVGVVRTPEDYFIETIRDIRKVHGTTLPVSIFTDGFSHEIKNILALENVSLIQGNRDIVDLVLLGRSSIIITSAGSTFSSWAGFLSDAPLLMHPDHIHSTVRPVSMQKNIYEGAPDFSNSVLLKNIQSIK